MTSSERRPGPWARLVHRLGTIAPHRQVQLLCTISVVTVAIMLLAMLGSLHPTQNALRVSNRRLVPVIEQLDVAREQYIAAATAVGLTMSEEPVVRTAALAELTAANSGGEVAYKRYLRLSSNLPRERPLQRSFVQNRTLALQAGADLLSEPAPTPAQLAAVANLSDAIRRDLNGLKELYETKVQESLLDAGTSIDATERQIVFISCGALILLLVAFGVAARSARSREERVTMLDRALHEDAERNELEARLQRSLEMAPSEPAVFRVVGRALALSAPGVPAEMLIADSSRAHFRQVTTSEDLGGPGCPVMSPADCPAATWGQTQIWPSSDALDACPYLQDRPEGVCSAVCVPVSVGGKTVGVVHVRSEDKQPPTEQVNAKIELVARKVGERIGMVRAFMRSETQAHTDPLTGLMNRRSLEEKVRNLTEDGITYVAAYGDLDHFKQLNDVHGHDAGDQALRLFARVLRDAVRPADLTARYGGEEFVVVLPDCTVSDAYAVINRLREELAHAQSGASMPAFTVSFGIAAARPENTFSQTLEHADAALLKAKATGRDRIVIAGPETPSSPPDAVPTVVALPEPTATT